jgi:hypothetical protein
MPKQKEDELVHVKTVAPVSDDVEEKGLLIRTDIRR